MKQTRRELQAERRGAGGTESTGPLKDMLFFSSSFPSSQGPTRLPAGEVKGSQTHKVIRTPDWHPRGELYKDLQHTNKLEED